MKQNFAVVRHELYDHEEVTRFTNMLTEHTENGYSIESCGIGGDTCRQGWAILSKSAEVKPVKPDLVEAARMIAEACMANDEDGCLTCPLGKGGKCLASGSLIPAYWVIAKE